MREVVRELSPELEEHMTSILDQVAERGRAEAIERGIEQAIEKGIERERRTTLLNLLAVKFGELDLSVAARIEAAGPFERSPSE